MTSKISRQRPNILFIVTDQQRHDYVGYRGQDWLETPNMDRLAASGTVFTNCITNSPICGPCRAGLAAGQRPHRLGILHNYNGYLPLSQPTIYQRLRDHGYWTGLIGKLDVEKGPYEGRNVGSDSRMPVMMSYGFCDHIHASAGMDVPERPMMPFHYYLEKHGLYEAFRDDREMRRKGTWCVGVNEDSPLPAEHHIENYVGTYAAEWVREAPDQHPWFLQVSFDGPHDPFDPPPEYAEKYRGMEMPAPIPADYDGKPAWVKNRFFTDDAADIQQARRQYAASIELIDDQIGRILTALSERDDGDNTIIVFTSDHGEMLGDFGLYQKHVPYEASARVPLVMSGPSIPVGYECDALAEWIDLNPTLAELVGLPPQHYIDARSLVPQLTNNAPPTHRENAIISLENYHALRSHNHKYIRNINDCAELYDLTQDPNEQNNLLAGERDEQVNDLAAAMNRALNEELQYDWWLR